MKQEYVQDVHMINLINVIGDEKMKKSKILFANCGICDGESAYDKETLKASTHNINGTKIVICCPCEDDLFRKFLIARISKKRMKELIEHLMMDEQNDILDLYR